MSLKGPRILCCRREGEPHSECLSTYFGYVMCNSSKHEVKSSMNLHFRSSGKKLPKGHTLGNQLYFTKSDYLILSYLKYYTYSLIL